MRYTRGITVFAAVTAAQGLNVCAGQGPPGYGDYTDWESWARVRPGVQAGLASSYARDGSNEDYNWYENPPGLVTADQTVTVRTIQGPGILYRFWMPHLAANGNYAVRIYFDGESTPRIDTRSIALLSGTFGYFAAPLVTTAAGGQVCYEPIPFQSSVRIESQNLSTGHNYYQYSFLTFPPGTPITSYTGSLTPEQQSARAAAAALFNNVGQHPAGASSTATRLSTPAATIAAGGCLSLADLSGPGLARQLNVRMESAGDAELSELRLRVYYDGESEPAVDAAVAEFFGAGRQRARYRSLPLGTDSPGGLYSFWPMPFHRSARIVLCNTSAAPISIDSGAVEYESRPIDIDLGYFHAHASTTVRSNATNYHPILSVTGCGHYVGNLLYLEQPSSSLGMLEGDEIVTIDGSRVLNGTGTEDAYSGGYYYNWVGVQNDEPEGPMPQSAIRPLHGLLYMHKDANPLVRVDQYRWQIADRVPFSRSLEVKIENFYAVAGATYTSVAFWYQLPPIPGDLDHDCDVDADDFAQFVSCVSGPAIPQLRTECQPEDFDLDGDVDHDDFGILQRCYTGAGMLGNPVCAD